MQKIIGVIGSCILIALLLGGCISAMPGLQVEPQAGQIAAKKDASDPASGN